MHATQEQLARALDQVEVNVTAGAFPRAAELARVVELALESYLQATLRHPHIACEVATEVLWRHCGLLKAGVEACDRAAALRAAADLKLELLEHHRAYLPAQPVSA